MKKQTYKEILENLEGVDDWLKSMGFSNEADRIRSQIKIVKKLNKIWKDEEKKKKFINSKGIDQIIWSLVETAEFADIYTALRDIKPLLIKEKLRVALKGPVNPNDETEKSNEARNTIFELNLSARLKHVGAKVEPGTRPDLICKVENFKIYIECKRPLKESGLKNNINKARKQLVRNINNSVNSKIRGIIAISVSNILNSGNKPFTFKKEKDIEKHHGDKVQTIGDKYSKVWKNIKNKKIIGILFHVITPAVLKENNLLFVAQETVLFQMPESSKSSKDLLKKFGKIFKQTANNKL